ncbi:DUF3274 domain-containing protein [Janthinobacterium sp.]|uniref:T6SS effector phospholipase Tle3 domain-containing protein n=1 Tax=Janthinobacterium sp. TaxID=1871054 RepID=UPI00293D42F6|nr:DUF3274 domain-containing protein [Janthinobacterium sp.]
MTYMKKTAPYATDMHGNALPKLFDSGENILVGTHTGPVLFNEQYLDVVQQMSLPGIIIFVHGVNSDGEWYSQTEDGLCKGLNERLKRGDEHMKFATPEGGQLTPAKYMSELTPAGFINPKMQADTFIESDKNFSPVIHFRWGYKANADELQQYGSSIYLNEENYWGGGPFANGCTSLPDLWSEGLSDTLFLWLHVQHLNPTNDRNVYSCPPRAYYVLAALRLARLVESIRKKQADVPITIVCHSQGNMIGMAAAFLGDRLSDVADASGMKGRCVADTYVLCNAPFSLLKKNFTESWTQGQVPDKKGNVGRQTAEARTKTLAAFFDIVRKQAPKQQEAASIDKFMANEEHGFNAKDDRMQYGYGLQPSTLGRVTLYCNPHDQVISASTVQGIGWRGMDQQEIDATKGRGVFCQRVFAQDFEVGSKGEGHYDYWKHHYRSKEGQVLKPGSDNFWFPNSQPAKFSLGKGLDANSNFFGKVLTIVSWPIVQLALTLKSIPINALPPDVWQVPLTAPNLPKAFKPEALRFGVASLQFDQGFDAPGESREKGRVREEGDPYAGDHPIPKGGSEGKNRKANDSAEGNGDSEAALRYEDHALLRMRAKREKLYKNEEKVVEEDDPTKASDAYKAWRTEKIKSNLADNLDTHATDHSTIMTNGMHAQRALAYDVAIGMSRIKDEDLRVLRTVADWRFLEGLDKENSNQVFLEYFTDGKFMKKLTSEWTKDAGVAGTGGSMPGTIIDERKFF